MSNPFLKEARSTVNSKLHKMGGSGPDQYARAEKFAHAKYQDGGEVEASPTLPNPFDELGGKKGGTRKPKPRPPTPLPPVTMNRGGRAKGDCT